MGWRGVAVIPVGGREQPQAVWTGGKAVQPDDEGAWREVTGGPGCVAARLEGRRPAPWPRPRELQLLRRREGLGGLAWHVTEKSSLRPPEDKDVIVSYRNCKGPIALTRP